MYALGCIDPDPMWSKGAAYPMLNHAQVHTKSHYLVTCII